MSLFNSELEKVNSQESPDELEPRFPSVKSLVPKVRSQTLTTPLPLRQRISSSTSFASVVNTTTNFPLQSFPVSDSQVTADHNGPYLTVLPLFASSTAISGVETSYGGPQEGEEDMVKMQDRKGYSEIHRDRLDGSGTTASGSLIYGEGVHSSASSNRRVREDLFAPIISPTAAEAPEIGSPSSMAGRPKPRSERSDAIGGTLDSLNGKLISASELESRLSVQDSEVEQWWNELREHGEPGAMCINGSPQRNTPPRGWNNAECQQPGLDLLEMKANVTPAQLQVETNRQGLDKPLLTADSITLPLKFSLKKPLPKYPQKMSAQQMYGPGGGKYGLFADIVSEIDDVLITTMEETVKRAELELLDIRREMLSRKAHEAGDAYGGFAPLQRRNRVKTSRDNVHESLAQSAGLPAISTGRAHDRMLRRVAASKRQLLYRKMGI